jgi:tetratricopeptide (TPR) repeat protein
MLKQWDEAIEVLSEILRRNAYSPATHALRGRSYTKLERYQDAVEDLEKAREIAPNGFGFYNDLLECHLALKQYERAAALLATLQSGLGARNFAADPARLETPRLIAARLIRLITATGHQPLLDARDQYIEARDQYFRRLELHLQSEVKRPAATDADAPGRLRQLAATCFLNGDSLFHQDEFDIALLYFNHAIALDPEYSEAYDHRGQIYASRNDSEQAIADFEKAIEFGNVYRSDRRLDALLQRAAGERVQSDDQGGSTDGVSEKRGDNPQN